MTVHDHLLDHGGLLDNNASVTTANVSGVLNVTLAPLPSADTLTLSSFMSLLTITLAYLTGALCFAIYTCSKSLGGWLYISIKIANLTNYLVCGYGVGLVMVGYWIGGEELMETLEEAKTGDFVGNPYSWLVGVGAIMVFQSLLGLIGLCVSENCDGRCKWMVIPTIIC